jgi:phosphatidylglycerophosphate synthase
MATGGLKMRGIALVEVPPGTDPQSRFAGRALLDRARAVALAGGLEPRFIAPSDSRPPESAFGGRPGEWLPPGAELPRADTSSDVVVIYRCDVAFVASLLRKVISQDPGANGIALCDDAKRIALLRTTRALLDERMPGSVADAAAGAAASGVPGRFAGQELIALGFASGTLRHPAAPGSGNDAGSAARKAEARLIGTLDNPRDGVFDGLLNRRLSRGISLALLRFPITPNQITALSIAIGIVAAFAIARPGFVWPIIGALLIQLSAVFDCVDGEIARAKVLESEWGEWFDVTGDTLIHIATFAGIAAHVWPELGISAAKWLAAVFATGGIAAFVVVTRAEKSEDEWRSIDSWKARLLARLLATLTTRDLSVLVLAAAASGLLAALLVGAAIGAHVFWVIVLWLHSALQAAARN